jgi:hypothetical protein
LAIQSVGGMARGTTLRATFFLLLVPPQTACQAGAWRSIKTEK